MDESSTVKIVYSIYIYVQMTPPAFVRDGLASHTRYTHVG